MSPPPPPSQDTIFSFFFGREDIQNPLALDKFEGSTRSTNPLVGCYIGLLGVRLRVLVVVP